MCVCSTCLFAGLDVFVLACVTWQLTSESVQVVQTPTKNTGARSAVVGDTEHGRCPAELLSQTAECQGGRQVVCVIRLCSVVREPIVEPPHVNQLPAETQTTESRPGLLKSSDQCSYSQSGNTPDTTDTDWNSVICHVRLETHCVGESSAYISREVQGLNVWLLAPTPVPSISTTRRPLLYSSCRCTGTVCQTNYMWCDGTLAPPNATCRIGMTALLLQHAPHQAQH